MAYYIVVIIYTDQSSEKQHGMDAIRHHGSDGTAIFLAQGLALGDTPADTYTV
ncbi:hypothetical protein SCLCIDRAFT_1216301, partial [Scleroderma citrinum Foug A]